MDLSRRARSGANCSRDHHGRIADPGVYAPGLFSSSRPDDYLEQEHLMKTTLLIAIAAAQALLSASLPVAAAENSFFAVLTSAAVCNTPPNADPPLCRLGQNLAGGTATVMIFGPTQLCAAILVHNLPLTNPTFPTAAHLHIGEASYTGPVVVQLKVPKANGGGNPGTSMMCSSIVPAATIESIRSNPHLYYIDVHGSGSQFGALRGQLF